MIKQVIVVRKDLNMRKGKLAAQVAHASMATLTQYIEIEQNTIGYVFFPPKHMVDWLNGDFTKIVVGCDSEIELLYIYRKAKDAGIITSLITDSGRTEFHNISTLTTAAIGPDEDEKVDEITGHLKLL